MFLLRVEQWSDVELYHPREALIMYREAMAEERPSALFYRDYRLHFRYLFGWHCYAIQKGWPAIVAKGSGRTPLEALLRCLGES